ncbi:MAG: GreA/GreB family elongation factor [Candidatus Roizmanbacteria bacterium]
MFNLTIDGHHMYTTELQQKLDQRPSIVTELSRARDLGDRSENAAYKVARSQLSALDRRIRFLEKMLRTARVVRPVSTERVTIGLKVTFESEGKTVTYRLVDSVQSDLMRGDLSNRSPLGSALMHKQSGDVIVYETPRGQKACTVILISY